MSYSIDVNVIHDDGSLSEVLNTHAADENGVAGEVEQLLRTAAPGSAFDLTIIKEAS